MSLFKRKQSPRTLDKKVESFAEQLIANDYSHPDNPMFDVPLSGVDTQFYTKGPGQNGRWFTDADLVRPVWDWLGDILSSEVSKNGDNLLVIVEGSFVYIWGAAKTLEENIGARVISIVPIKHTPETGYMVESRKLVETKSFNKYTASTRTGSSLKNRYEEFTTLARSLGYESIEDFIHKRAEVRKPRNVVLGIDNISIPTDDWPDYPNNDWRNRFTGVHEDGSAPAKGIYDYVMEFAADMDPRAIIYLCPLFKVGDFKKAMTGREGHLSAANKNDMDMDLPWREYRLPVMLLGYALNHKTPLTPYNLTELEVPKKTFRL